MEPEITVIIVDDDFGSVQRLQDDLSAFSCIRILDTAMTAEIGKNKSLNIIRIWCFWTWSYRICLALNC